ncbi:hypothetical protein GCM10009779_03030 [Polymorphospora rubra]|uniref:Uncharacterized protein n=1 Tax=Polymorphospora rubra TaxID=338584 RepID=A0A810MYW3_9ACTN|nr:hypothetical protein Prubr_26750 [Polymorphospora rubra]
MCLHKSWIGECSIEHGFSQSTDRGLPTAVHRQPSSKSLTATLAGHAYVHEITVRPLTSKVNAGKLGRRDSRIIERQPG